MPAEVHSVGQNYGISHWGEGYFGINRDGHLTVKPHRDSNATIDLFQLARVIRDAGSRWPVLVRFTDILHDRVAALCGSFKAASEELDYGGAYTAVYPIKVNQQRVVVEEILSAGKHCVGLETGSKPELMAVLALSRIGGTIICNGYKDREYIRLALIGKAMSHRVVIVVEKPTELELVLKEAEDLGIEPLLGVRVRLAASASGKWQNSGGEKSKFGLSASQLLELVQKLREADRLHQLTLLHTHIGSQIPNLRDIRRGLNEAARYYAELRALGAPIDTVDVGGGLGVDYEGTGTRHYCSINYSLETYAREVVKALERICTEHGLPHPDIITESGRAMTAHHAVLITNVIEREPPITEAEPSSLPKDAPEALKALADEINRASSNSPHEVFQEARHGLDEARELFERGQLDLADWARAEQFYYTAIRKLLPRLRTNKRRDRELLDVLHEQMADKVFLNFSIFQSLPDTWAIDQVFPAMPIHRLNETPTRSALIQDLTCDSDGCIGIYVDQDGIERSLPLHEPESGTPYLLGFFLVGAYQEILGDMHNLFGDTDAVNVKITEQDKYELTDPERGDTVNELLTYLHFDIEQMIDGYRNKLSASSLSQKRQAAFFNELREGLHGYTYLED